MSDVASWDQQALNGLNYDSQTWFYQRRTVRFEERVGFGPLYVRSCRHLLPFPLHGGHLLDPAITLRGFRKAGFCFIF